MTNPAPHDASEIVHHDGGTTFAGRDAVNFYRAVTLKSALNLYAKTGIRVTRHASPTVMLQIASEYTGKTYKRGQYKQAAEDMTAWIETMRAALPISDERTKEPT